MAYRYRSACQMCVSPAAREANLNVNIFGLPVRQHILVRAGDQSISERLHLDQVTDGEAEKELILQHERVLARMSERHRRTMERVFQNLNDLLPNNVDELVTQLESCASCQRCMEVCPICAVDSPIRDANDNYNRQDVMRWLVSCAGCGMCEQACPKHLPLSTIFGYIRETLDQEYSYKPGLSLEDPLPIQ
jgi:formate dehydrogenase subunit beta